MLRNKRTKLWLAVLGPVVFIGSVVYILYVLNSAVNAIFASIGNYYVPPPYLQIVKHLACPSTLAEGESTTVVATLSNSTASSLTASVSIQAPGFQVSPAESSVEMELMPNAEAEMSWVIYPKSLGSQVFRVSAISKAGNSTPIACGIAVTNTLGLTAWQAQLLSLIGTIFGPALSAPWLYDKWQEHRKAKAEKKRQASEIEKLKADLQALKAQQEKKD